MRRRAERYYQGCPTNWLLCPGFYRLSSGRWKVRYHRIMSAVEMRPYRYFWAFFASTLILATGRVQNISFYFNHDGSDHLRRIQCSYTYTFISCLISLHYVNRTFRWILKLQVSSTELLIIEHASSHVTAVHPLMSSWMMLFDSHTARGRTREYMTFLNHYAQILMYHCTSWTCHGSGVYLLACHCWGPC